MNYDAWLEKPYQDRYAQDAAYEQAAEYLAERDGREVEDISEDEIVAYLEDEDERRDEWEAERRMELDDDAYWGGDY